ncbi:PEP-CTERM sorting domain-containing protein [Massilia horti]|uniref:PEP-CTERM sorting domain-containing protein n=2 Tax=Massilia horti TaxID=2562153 RepID=A0A4Y9TB02_9BURK|nr:PEP-CTERM sorting domain-containing protein [Massilia horti]
MTMKTIIAAGTLACVLAGFSAQAYAQATGTGSSLLDDSGRRQLERWLGRGEFTFNNVFTLQPGDTSLDFHAAVDGKGETFTLLQVTNQLGDTYLVGGYNPQSWSSTDGWHVTDPDYLRTAFLFNMTVPAVYRQVPSTYILPSQGSRQTYNAADHGPTFGAGPDLFVNSALDTAISWQLTYGDPLDEGKSIIDRSTGGQFVRINAMELYTLAPIPEPEQAGMLAAGLALLGWRLRRRRSLVE